MNGSLVSHLGLKVALCSLLIGICTSCEKRVNHLPSGPITISGELNDANGLPLPNATVRLFRDRRYLETTTDAKGAYAFPNLAAASYLLHPRLDECHFLPPHVDLDNLISSTVQNFGGWGRTCGGAPTVNMGAMSGPLTVSGHVKDAGGLPVLGARVDLGEHHRAVRFTDVTGSYTFHVKPGDFELAISGTCIFTPRRVEKDDLKASIVRDFLAGLGCMTSVPSNLTSTGSAFVIRQGTNVIGTTYVHLEDLASPAAALSRLNQIAAEQPTPSISLTIAGFSAIERQTSINLPGLDPDIAGSAGHQTGPFFALTTAIADDHTVVRFESQLPKESSAATIAQFFQLARNFTPDALNSLHGPPLPAKPTVKHTPPALPPSPGITAAGIVTPGFGELVVASSDTANAVVYGTQGGPFLSTNGGQTVKASTYNKAPAPPNAAFSTKGDPAVAVGAPDSTFHQTMYFAQLEQAANPPAGNNTPIVAIALYQSPNNGATFNSLSFPINCSVAAAACVVPDQVQLAADRITRVVTPTGSADQLYVAWRNFTLQNSNAHTIAVACSTDGGLNWTIDLNTLTKSGGDFPRMSVGPDGSLLVAYAVYGPTTYSLQAQKWDSCASGFKPNGSPQTIVKVVTEVTDMAGLDRAPSGNYSPAHDDSDGSGQRIFVSYANEASAGNDDIHVSETRDGGTTWPLDSIVSTASNGRKFFPYICSTVGKKFVTWYDRRNSSAASPDLTAFYRSTVSDNGSASTVGIGAETNVSGIDDPQCSSGFSSAGVLNGLEETACKNLPAGFIQGGTCQLATCPPNVPAPCGTGNACDFRAATPCPTVGEACQPSGGAPKYGDYNGSACAQGTLFTAWASSTPAKGAACLIDGIPSPTAAQCCSGKLNAGTCSPSAAACVANGNACGLGTPCCSQGNGGQCQANKCMPAITMYTGSSNSGPPPPSAPVTITYHQTGACNGYVDGSGGHFAGPNQAHVFFGIERINNSGGTAAFNFDPANLFIQQAAPRHLDSTLSVYAGIFGPFAVQASTVNSGNNISFSPVAQGAMIVVTSNNNGSTEANQTAYFLQYDRQPTDPLIVLVKSDLLRTSWPNTQDCKLITLQ